MPIISVIIPTYNRASLLPRAINSVLGQTFTDFEIIVVDDASTDNTRDVVKSFSDSRIFYIRHEKNKGAQAARNKGISRARGKYIAFLDTDDEWLSEKLEREYSLFTQLSPEYGVVYSGVRIIDELNRIEFECKIGVEGDIYKMMLSGPSIDFITPLIRAKCFEKIGLLDERVPSYQEWDTFIRLSHYYKFKYIPEILAIYHIHRGERISKDHQCRYAGYLYNFRKHYLEIKKMNSFKVISEHHKNLAIYALKSRLYGRFFKHLLCFFIYAPDSIKKGKNFLAKIIWRKKLRKKL